MHQVKTLNARSDLHCCSINCIREHEFTLLLLLLLKVTGVEKAIYQTLQTIDALFENYTVPDQWDGDKMSDFRSIVYRQIVDSKCVRKQKTFFFLA